MTPRDSRLVTRFHLIETDSNAFVAGRHVQCSGGSYAAYCRHLRFRRWRQCDILSRQRSALLRRAVCSLQRRLARVTGGVYDANVGGTYNNGARRLTRVRPTLPTRPRAESISRCSLEPARARRLPNSSTTNSPSIRRRRERRLCSKSIRTRFRLALHTSNAYRRLQLVPRQCRSRAGSFAVGLIGQGVFHNNAARYQPDASGQVSINSTGAAITAGTLDINSFSATFADRSDRRRGKFARCSRFEWARHCRDGSRILRRRSISSTISSTTTRHCCSIRTRLR